MQNEQWKQFKNKHNNGDEILQLMTAAYAEAYQYLIQYTSTINNKTVFYSYHK